MHQEYLRRMWLSSLYKRLLKLFRSPKAASDAENYETWRHEFMQSRLLLGLWVALIFFLTFTSLELRNFWFKPDEFNNDWLITQIIVEICLLFCLGLFRLPVGRQHPTLIFLALSWSVTIGPQFQSSFNGFFEPSLLIWPLMFFGQATLMPVRWSLHLISQLGVLFYCVVAVVFLRLEVRMPAVWLTPNAMILYMFWICFICNLSVFLYERLQRGEFKARRDLEKAYSQLQNEQELSEKLLLNILPEPIAIRLKQDHQIIAESFGEVSVLFADIVGFTEISSQVSPHDLVQLLNEIFSAFDHLAEKHGLEKIKTIGDAYMVVAGLPVQREDHAASIADMALDMQKALENLNFQTKQNFRIRIGIATGPVVAGVIGIKKFIYDLWGDTVNMASRMESQGIAGRIQVTRATYECLKKEYIFEERGVIHIKGKGEMSTYFLETRK
ncbi:MAG TPA: adenylate/guanylate cyclase domain-containing protein [Halomicronema sp.]